jgi:endonuclease/exonuclease/phosphatase family metal-dependent hydrolase
MAGELRTMQWNIGGGKILAEGQDPSQLAAYSDDGVQHIIDVIDDEEPNIITLQETHPDIPAEIASALRYESWINHPVSASHIDPRYELGHGLVCDFPVVSDWYWELPNPQWETEWEDGSKATSHPKGISSYLLRLTYGKGLLVQNLHLTPFRRFGIEPDSAEADPILRAVEDRVGQRDGARLLQGDFNLDVPSLRLVLPGLFEVGFSEVVQDEPTTPKGRRLDHVLYTGMRVIESTVIKDVLTDHYPIVTKFELK